MISDYFRKEVKVKTKSGKIYVGFMYDVVLKDDDDDYGYPDDFIRLIGEVRSDVYRVYLSDIDTIEIIK